MTIDYIKIKDVMRPPHLIKSSATFFETINEMICNRTNSLVVIDDAGKVVGEVSVLNLLKKVVPPYISDENEIMSHFMTDNVFFEDIDRVKDSPITEFMIAEPPIVTLNDTLVEAAMKAISSERSRIIVVDESNGPIGVLTRTEIKQVIGKHLGIKGCFSDQ